MLNVKRPMTKRTHTNGMQVIMYKDAPGEYCDASGHPVKDEIAEAAGFDTAKEGLKKEK